ncbi:MAG: hypothetical protein DCC75_11420, partial [Proteobacteria bacterium]
MSLVPLLLRPKILTIRNRWRSSPHAGALKSQGVLARDALLLALSVGIMYGIFIGTLRTLHKVNEAIDIAFIPPSLPLGLLFLFLLMMLLFSNSVATLGSLFLSHDLELLLAAPLKRGDFFKAKLCEIALSSSWMAFLFALPVLIAFGIFYKAPIAYYAIAPIVVVPFFVAPAALSLFLIPILARILPANRTKEIFFLIGAACIFSLYMLAQLLSPEGTSFHNSGDILRILAILSIPNVDWSPSYWAARSLEKLLLA